MDPLSVSTACVGLLAAVAQLSLQISVFISGVREARRDLDAVSRELVSLSLCLEALRDDSSKIQYPDGLKQNLLAVMKNCDVVTKQMLELVEKMSLSSLGRRVQWTAVGRDEMNQYRSSLETHKSALDIALDLTALLITSAVKEDTEAIRADTTAMKGDTSQIPLIKQDTAQISILVQEIASLRQQVTVLEQGDSRGGIVLQRFLDDTNSYAETVLDEYISDDEGERSELALSTPQNNTPTQGSTSLSGNGTNCHEEAVPHSTEQRSHSSAIRPEEQRQSGDYPIAITTAPGATQLDLSPTSSPDLPGRDQDTSNSRQVARSINVIGRMLSSQTHLTEAISCSPASTVVTMGSSDVSHLQATVPLDHKGLSPRERSQRGLVLYPKKLPDYAAIKAARFARSRISPSERRKLDEKFEVLILGRTSDRKSLSELAGDFFYGRKLMFGELVGTMTDVKNALDAGAETRFAYRDAIYFELQHHRRLDVIELLLSRGILEITGLGINDDLFYLAISVARSQDIAYRSVVCQLLLDYGLDPDSGNAVYAAVCLGAKTALQTLLANGANTEIVGHRHGCTPLGKAIFADEVDIARILLEHGAKPQRPPRLTFASASDTYKAKTNTDMRALLAEYGCQLK